MTCLGFAPRIRDRCFDAEMRAFCEGRISRETMRAAIASIHESRWRIQFDAGVAQVPCNDLSHFDSILETATLMGVIPSRFQGFEDPLDRAFAMAFGSEPQACGSRPRSNSRGIPGLERKKWVQRPGWYSIPELRERQEFALAPDCTLIQEIEHCRSLQMEARPVILGPISFLLLSRVEQGGLDPLSLLPGLVPAYRELFSRVSKAGVRWVQLDEPCLDGTRLKKHAPLLRKTYETIAAPDLSILLVPASNDLQHALPVLASLPVGGIHLDLARDTKIVAPAVALTPSTMSLSLGLVDGCSPWRTLLDQALTAAEHVADRLGYERTILAPSCSMRYLPLDVDDAVDLDISVQPWMAFAREKLEELVTLSQGLSAGREAIAGPLAESTRYENLRASHDYWRYHRDSR